MRQRHVASALAAGLLVAALAAPTAGGVSDLVGSTIALDGTETLRIVLRQRRRRPTVVKTSIPVLGEIEFQNETNYHVRDRVSLGGLSVLGFWVRPNGVPLGLSPGTRRRRVAGVGLPPRQVLDSVEQELEAGGGLDAEITRAGFSRARVTMSRTGTLRVRVSYRFRVTLTGDGESAKGRGVLRYTFIGFTE